jgi:two-component system, NtrC family, response regulator HydG
VSCLLSPEPAAKSANCRYRGQTVLAVGAHPSDIEMGIGGNAARLARDGARLVLVVASIPDRYERRLEEAWGSASLLGGELHVLLNHGCSRVEDHKSYEVQEKMDELVRRIRPAAVFTHGEAELDRDREMVHHACLASQKLHPFDCFFYSHEAARSDMSRFDPKMFVDVSTTFALKMQAINIYAGRSVDRTSEPGFIRETAREYGRRAGVAYAEALQVGRMLLV